MENEKTQNEDVNIEVEETKPLSPEEKLAADYAELQDKNMRLMAEYDNFRKRAAKEKDAIYPQAVTATVLAIIPIIDNFERAINTETSDDVYKKGVEMTYQSFLEAIKKLGVESFGEIGDAFDPNIHSAIMTIEDDSAEKDTIAEVFQKGYKLGDRIIRVAMVKVVG